MDLTKVYERLGEILDSMEGRIFEGDRPGLLKEAVPISLLRIDVGHAIKHGRAAETQVPADGATDRLVLLRRKVTELESALAAEKRAYRDAVARSHDLDAERSGAKAREAMLKAFPDRPRAGREAGKASKKTAKASHPGG